MTTFSVRMDSEVKKQFDEFCSQVGMNATTAFNMFARAVLREKRLPFDVAVVNDPFYSESNLRVLRESIRDADAGKLTAHELIEVDDD
ncbi:MAG: type II toxin-antitoxin system RelB/DinJ family antitoxin [Oscillospiraceae bacterium]|nr:type II toxin-antitoxin system RelB/DinJ family antitoxin [Oscillospiraceae bacterium]